MGTSSWSGDNEVKPKYSKKGCPYLALPQLALPQAFPHTLFISPIRATSRAVLMVIMSRCSSLLSASIYVTGMYESQRLRHLNMLGEQN